MSNISLLDANVLVYARNTQSPYHERAKAVRDQVLTGTIAACIAPQVLWEFFAVVTNSKRIEKPLSPVDAYEEIEQYWNSEMFIKILPNENTFVIVGRLIGKYQVTGQHIHDVHLVATMIDNNVFTIYSGDETLQKFTEIRAINPFWLFL